MTVLKVQAIQIVWCTICVSMCVCALVCTYDMIDMHSVCQWLTSCCHVSVIVRVCVCVCEVMRRLWVMSLLAKWIWLKPKELLVCSYIVDLPVWHLARCGVNYIVNAECQNLPLLWYMIIIVIDWLLYKIIICRE